MATKITLINDDCLNHMRSCGDNFYDIAIVDPPYGLGAIWRKDRKNRAYKTRGKGDSWNNAIPPKAYFDELLRISENQIIWGWNFFTKFLPPTNSLIYWSKGFAPGNTFSDGELAYTSFGHSLREIKIQWAGFIRDGKREGWHPTEKPIKLYEWLFDRYVTDGMKVLDTHLGSAASAVVASGRNCEFTGIEINNFYYNKGKKRVAEAQTSPLERGYQVMPLIQ